MSPGFVPGAGHHHAEVSIVLLPLATGLQVSSLIYLTLQTFWQNISSAVGCNGGHLSCMRQVNFTTLNTAASNVQENYTYQFQPRVDGDFVADTCKFRSSNLFYSFLPSPFLNFT
jgi:hypothetical protein